MGFLRRLFARNFNEVNDALRTFDERISKIEGVGGHFEPKKDIMANNKQVIKNVAQPVDVNDCARYSDAIRYRTIHMDCDMSLIGGDWYHGLGNSPSECLSPMVPIEIKKLWFFARKLTINNTSCYAEIRKYDSSGAVVDICRSTINTLVAGRASATSIPDKKRIIVPSEGWFIHVNAPVNDYSEFTLAIDYLILDR